MKRCLYSGRGGHYLGRRPSVPYSLAVLRRLSSALGEDASSRGISFDQQRRSNSSAHPTPLPRALPLRDYALAHAPKIPIYMWKRKFDSPWVGWLDKYLPPGLQRNPGPDTWDNEVAGDVLAQARELLHILNYARHYECDPLCYMGFAENRWPAVHALITTLLDAADSVRLECVHRQPMSNLDWGSGAGLSIDQLTDRDTMQVQINRESAAPIDLNSMTNRPFGNDLIELLMEQVFLILGEIVHNAAHVSPEKSKVAMPYVYRILARLHHAGMVPDRVYRYSTPDDHDTVFRPPTMHLLSTHIMSILSDAAWVEHEPRVTAEGEESPFLPFKMGVRELGPEIWLELILWCCVENGFMDAIHLLKRIMGRNSWHVRSWRPFLQDSKSVWNTKIDSEETWRHPDSRDSKPSPAHGNAAFHGLGKRTISAEVAMSIITSLMNRVYLGMGWRGVAPRHLIVYFRVLLRQLIAQGSENTLESTTKAMNAFAVRFLESGALEAHNDPHTFEAFLNTHPYVVPPWVNGQRDMKELDHLSPSQIYDETSAFAGMMEYNIGTYATRAQTHLALGSFNKLLNVVDESKRQNINKSFELLRQPEASVPFFDARYPSAQEPLESCIPQMSNATFAKLLDIARVSKGFEFTRWLLSSDDIDGPAIPASAYGDQALAPSLLRLATETGNEELYEQVVRSLSRPLSLNTLRALLSAKISRGEWDNVLELFSYIRDYRAKSWGFSNISALATAILRMDQSLQHSRKTGKAPPPGTKDSLDRAKDVLLRVLNGEFGTPHYIRTDNYYPLAIYGFCHILTSIPGPLSDVASAVDPHNRNRSSNASFPILPTEPFNDLLEAVVDVHGSAGGKALWKRWLVERPMPTETRRHQGGVSRLYTRSERDFRKGDPMFDPVWFNSLHAKMAFPNLDTVRIIARKAVAESASSSTPANSEPGDVDGDDAQPAQETPEDVLDFCVLRFKNLKLVDQQIDLETGGHLTRMRTDDKLIRRPRRRRAKFREGYPPGWTG